MVNDDSSFEVLQSALDDLWSSRREALTKLETLDHLNFLRSTIRVFEEDSTHFDMLIHSMTKDGRYIGFDRDRGSWTFLSSLILICLV